MQLTSISLEDVLPEEQTRTRPSLGPAGEEEVGHIVRDRRGNTSREDEHEEASELLYEKLVCWKSRFKLTFTYYRTLQNGRLAPVHV